MLKIGTAYTLEIKEAASHFIELLGPFPSNLAEILQSDS